MNLLKIRGKQFKTLYKKKIMSKVKDCAIIKCEFPQIHSFRQNEVHASRNQRYSNDYIHAKTMYNLPAMVNRKMKFGALVWGGILSGIFIPLVACGFQQRKAKGG